MHSAKLVGPKIFYLIVIIIGLLIIYTVFLGKSYSSLSERKLEYAVFELEKLTITLTDEQLEANTKFELMNQRTEKLSCYQFPNDLNKLILPNILEAKLQPVFGRSIFFLMTACAKEEVFSLTARYVLPSLQLFI